MTGTIYPSGFLCCFEFISLSFNFLIYTFQSFVCYFRIFSIQIFLSRFFFFFTLLQKFLPYSVCTYMCTYIFLEFYQVFPVYFLFKRFLTNTMGFSGGSDSKETTCSAGDLGSISG